MAIVESLVDDLDGTPITDEGGTIPFAIDGQRYEIDLSEEHQAALRESFAEWIGHARKVSVSSKQKRQKRLVVGPVTKSVSTEKTPKSRKEYLAAVRTYAAVNGLPAPSRGRIPRSTVEAYEQAK